MLNLPENLAELSKDRRCDFVKKAYKKAALKWHPDKAAESGKLRAARKMNEMTEARDHVNERLGCVAPKKPDENDPRAQQQQRQHPHFRNFHHGGFPGGGGFGGGGYQQTAAAVPAQAGRAAHALGVLIPSRSSAWRG